MNAREGKFTLYANEWMALERDSQPALQAGRSGVCIGLCLGASAMDSREGMVSLYPGHGLAPIKDLRVAFRLWRAGAQKNPDEGMREPSRALLVHMNHLQSHISARLQQCPGHSLAQRQHVLTRLQRARMYLEGNADRVVRVSELAERANLSYWHFSRAFKSVYGESPQAYGVKFRLDVAARLLCKSELGIGEIAELCGFENPSSFARAFRAHFGTCARGYRLRSTLPSANSAHIYRA
ncbi:helix-turn-helix domain-containing protein [Stenotrophomonas maltophilia]|uniref:helix-turn-helix domain-containing protein n=1 Tax=Stenotrophomonas maltophilia TaxID=40324 RepID=UPI001559F537